MKVAYVTLAPFISGAERSLQTILRYAPAAGIEPFVLCPPRSPMASWCNEHDIRVRTVPIAERDGKHPFRWVRSVITILFVLWRERVDVVHSNQVWSFAATATAAGLLKIPRVCHMRDEVPAESIRWWCSAGVEAVICISDHIRRLVEPAFAEWRKGPEMVTLINPVGGGNNISLRSATRSRTARVQLGAREECFTFGFVGQIAPVKGVMQLLEAIAGVGGEWQLLIAGQDPSMTGDYERTCREAVQRLGISDRVQFLGFVEDISAVYEALDAVVVPSLEEPLGRVPLEAGMYGVPAIGYATGGLVEIIKHGVTGWLVSKGDVPALGRALQQVVSEPMQLQQAGDAAQMFVSTTCAPAHHLRSLRALYCDILHKHPGVSAAQTSALPGVENR